MNDQVNNLGQEVGESLPEWVAPEWPAPVRMAGRHCALAPLDPSAHSEALYRVFAEDADGRDWTYLPYGPFDDFKQFDTWLQAVAAQNDPQFYVIEDADNREVLGLLSLLRIQPKVGSIEVGHIHYSPQLQKTAAATEAMFLLMQRVFDQLGYRRYEWKCDNLNSRSKAAALRLGFVFEGVFRQATVYKGRNRDTAWFSITDKEWSELKPAYEHWLDPNNFNAEGKQIQSLASLRNVK